MTDSVGVSLDALLHAARAARAIRPDVPLALATLVDVEGSSFRQPGARLLIDAECRCLAGAISGGCLEADVAARAAAVCASGIADYLVYDLRDDLQAIWGFDAACDGVAHILLEPLHDTAWLEEAVELRRARKRGSVLTLVKVGSMPNGSDLSRAVDHMSEGIDRTQRIGVAAGTVGAREWPFLEALRGDRGAKSLFLEEGTVTVNLVGGSFDIDRPADVQALRDV